MNSEKAAEILGFTVVEGNLLDSESEDWHVNNKEGYARVEAFIKKQHTKRANYKMDAWCDTSGFEYWHNSGLSENYLIISIDFHKDNITKRDVNTAAKDYLKMYNKIKAFIIREIHKEP